MDELFDFFKIKENGNFKKSSKDEMGDFIGDSKQLWENAENGYHVDSERNKFYVERIDINYAMNMRRWYLRIHMTSSERKRLLESKLFQQLDEIIGVRPFGGSFIMEDQNNEGGSTKLDTKILVARIRTHGKNDSYHIKLEEDENILVGDTVVTTHSDQLRVGEVLSIFETDMINSDFGELIDVITKSSKAFIELKNKVRIKEIKKEIEERMKIVDERQEMEMYAKADKGIKELMDELDKMD